MGSHWSTMSKFERDQERKRRKQRRSDRRKAADEIIRRLEREIPLSDSCRQAAKDYLRTYVIPAIDALGDGCISAAMEITQ